YNTYFELTSKRILALLQEIGTKTPTPQQKARLILMLRLLSDKLKSSRTEVERVRADIKSFTQDMAKDHTELTTGAGSVTRAIEDNNKQVAALIAQIAALNAEIQQLNVQLIAAANGLAASVFVSYLLMNVTPYIAIPIAIIGISVSIGFIIDAMVRISKKQQEIIDQSATLKKAEAQGVVLAAISATVDAMKASIDAISKNIDVVSSAWATLDVKMESVIKNLTAAREEHWRDTLLQEIDIEAAQVAWKQLKEYAEKLQEVKLKDSKQVTAIKAIA